jgi:hypothetical protein
VTDAARKGDYRAQGLTVYGGWVIHHEGRAMQVHAVVAARSGAAAMRALGITRGHLNDYFSETRNDEDVAQAMTSPRTAFWREMDPPYGEWRVLGRG